jgi:ATP-binding cassette subfamily F protein uup
VLAKLFTRPSNLLVLDEPTNDLDVETLEVLEERLADYTGTLIVVSHDRAFLDNVVDKILVFEPGGRIVEYAGGYSDWLRRGHELAQMDAPQAAGSRGDGSQARAAARAEARPRKLGYREQRELDALPARIDALEAEIAAIEAEMAAPDFYARPWEQTQPVLDGLAARQAEHDRLAERWVELEELQDQLATGRAS